MRFVVRAGVAVDGAATEQQHASTSSIFEFEGGRASSLLAASPSSNRQHPHRHLAGPFASLSAAFLAALPVEKAPGEDQVKESTTGIVYPEDVCPRGALHGCTQLTGLGVRSKNLVVAKVNVYTVGLYVDHGRTRSALARHTGKSAKQLAGSQDLFDDLVRADGLPKALRLVIHYGKLKKSAFVDALDERLAPAVTSAGHGASLDAFKRQLDATQLRKGTEFLFESRGGGVLATHVDGTQVGTITSAPLVHALFNIYVGGDPVSAPAKQSMGRGLAQLLA